MPAESYCKRSQIACVGSFTWSISARGALLQPMMDKDQNSGPSFSQGLDKARDEVLCHIGPVVTLTVLRDAQLQMVDLRNLSRD